MIWLPVPHPAIKIFGLELGVESSLQKEGFSMVVAKEIKQVLDDSEAMRSGFTAALPCGWVQVSGM